MGLGEKKLISFPPAIFRRVLRVVTPSLFTIKKASIWVTGLMFSKPRLGSRVDDTSFVQVEYSTDNNS